MCRSEDVPRRWRDNRVSCPSGIIFGDVLPIHAGLDGEVSPAAWRLFRQSGWSIMKPSILFFALILPAFSAAQEAHTEMEPQFPQQQSARDLLKACASSALTRLGNARRQYCAGFISGVEESLRLLGHPDMSICPPRRVTARGMAAVYVQYASSRSAELDKPAAEMALQALMQAYPCGNSP